MDYAMETTVDPYLRGNPLSEALTWGKQFEEFLKDNPNFIDCNYDDYVGQAYTSNPSAKALSEKLGEKFWQSPDVFDILLDSLNFSDALGFLVMEHRMLAVVGVPIFLGSVVTLMDPTQLKGLIMGAKDYAYKKQTDIVYVERMDLNKILLTSETEKLLYKKLPFMDSCDSHLTKKFGGQYPLPKNGTIVWANRMRNAVCLTAFSGTVYILGSVIDKQLTAMYNLPFKVLGGYIKKLNLSWKQWIDLAKILWDLSRTIKK